MDSISVFCLFHHYSDYECSAETLIGVYLSQDDAEFGLLELIARGKRLDAKNRAFNERFRDCHERFRHGCPTEVKKGIKKAVEAWQQQYEMGLRIINEERLQEFGPDSWMAIPDTNIAAYSIEEVEIGKVRA